MAGEVQFVILPPGRDCQEPPHYILYYHYLIAKCGELWNSPQQTV
jgi:hypothetical protein